MCLHDRLFVDWSVGRSAVASAAAGRSACRKFLKGQEVKLTYATIGAFVLHRPKIISESFNWKSLV